MSATRVDLVREGAHATKAEVGPFEIQLLTFAAHNRLPAFDVERPYLVVVLEGDVAKRFGRVHWSLGRDSLATMPVGAAHASDFGGMGAKVLAVRSRDAEAAAFGDLLGRLRPRPRGGGRRRSAGGSPPSSVRATRAGRSPRRGSSSSCSPPPAGRSRPLLAAAAGCATPAS